MKTFIFFYLCLGQRQFNLIGKLSITRYKRRCQHLVAASSFKVSEKNSGFNLFYQNLVKKQKDGLNDPALPRKRCLANYAILQFVSGQEETSDRRHTIQVHFKNTSMLLTSKLSMLFMMH